MLGGDAALIDEWVFAPAKIRLRPPGQLIAVVLGLFAAALVGFLFLRSSEAPAQTPTEVLGTTEEAANADPARASIVGATVLFEIVDRHEDGSVVVDMTVERVLSEDAPDLGATTLRLGIAPEGRLGSVTGLREGLALDPSTSAGALVGDLSGDGMAIGHSWTAQVELSLIDS